jgi:hypothetical protein
MAILIYSADFHRSRNVRGTTGGAEYARSREALISSEDPAVIDRQCYHAKILRCPDSFSPHFPFTECSVPHERKVL